MDKISKKTKMIKKIKKFIVNNNLDGYIIPKNDRYFTEYSNINNLKKVTDFTGSAGFALILKNLSDRQISLDKKLINYLIKRIDRSYSKIFDFIYKIDEISLKKKKSIDLKIIKEVLGE